MNRIEDYEVLKFNIVRWLKDYYWENNLKSFVVGVAGIRVGVIDSIFVEVSVVVFFHLIVDC